MFALTPATLLEAYAAGIFPMAVSRSARRIEWIDPRRRGVLPLERFHVPRRLRRTARKAPYRIEVSRAFPAVIEACAEVTPERPETWLNDELIGLYVELWRDGFAHSVECYSGEELVGGLYGVSLGGAFFGESMFSRATDASKLALIELVRRLKAGGYVLLDTQFVTEHLLQFGATEVPRPVYRRMLAQAVKRQASFPLGQLPDGPLGDSSPEAPPGDEPAA